MCVCVCTSGSRRSVVSSWEFSAASAEHRPGSQTDSTSRRTYREREMWDSGCTESASIHSDKQTITHTHTHFLSPRNTHSHGKDGCNQVQRSNEDSQLSYQSCQEQSPGRLSISLAMTKHLDRENRTERERGVREEWENERERRAIYTLQHLFIYLTLRKGMMLSLAMAWRRRGAPVSDWRPAPHVEKKEPITMTQGEGQDKVPTTRFPFTESPNLPNNRQVS